ncbi:precorrin-2 dehydrogenase/sirohydrochlorin ferrochelatase family protein [Orenia marismortui]|uniref:precorrin-2 dehydrogenase n=1 Tax=Orenia marismortui TaxID=46469 RepID=A0A4R8GY71_9FIRM|nr:bifunctional precorrin-2 dehydrogenase/sirohydrochlorin ferrochelatase [Orenia marismortui]TDX51384.1 precorrin-2 dehydrogenase [Orenia marismortui]
MNTYPINLNLTGKKVLVIGGGQVASRKTRRLVRTGAKITIVSPELTPELEAMINDYSITYYSRNFKDEDLRGVFLVFALTDNRRVNNRISQLADENNILINVADSLEESMFTLPSIIKRGDLLLTISTGGSLPALSKEIRRNLEEEFGLEYSIFLTMLKRIRPIILKEIDDKEERRRIFRSLADLRLIEQFTQNKEAALDEVKSILGDNIAKKLFLDWD